MPASNCCQKQNPGVVTLGLLLLKHRCCHEETHHEWQKGKVVQWQSTVDGHNGDRGEKWEEREAGRSINGVIQRLGQE